MEQKQVTIVVPVYADWPSLGDCLESLITTVDLMKHKILLVNDCGPEADSLEKKIKAKIKNHEGFEYFRNPKNLGFVKTCNRAVFELDRTENDILLLNSDTKPTAGWLEEMQAVLYLSSKNGTVTPRTNNATLATVPLWAAPQKGIKAEESYKFYNKIKPKLPRFYVVPVGHGFCMLIRRSLTKKYGLFDEAFGKGYGEEVDFCMRIKAGGYLSILSNWSYVFHLEARSFTLPIKNELLQKNNQIIWERYPTYRQVVRGYLEKVTAEEAKIEEELGIQHQEYKEGSLKKMIKRNQKSYSVARRLRRRLNMLR